MPSNAAYRRNRCTDARPSAARVAAVLLCSLLAVAAAPVAAATLTVLGLAGTVPDHWQGEQPSSNMRLAQALVPPDAHFVVYYFGRDQGGTPELNIARWQSQFSRPDGTPVEATVTRFESGGMPVVLAEMRGDYARAVGTDPNAPKLPDHILLAAIVETAEGKLFVHLYGPAATVERERGALNEFLQGLGRTS